MQNQKIEEMVQLIVKALEQEKRRVLFLLTPSDREEAVVTGELFRLLEMYPDSRICMDPMPDEMFLSIRHDGRCQGKFLEARRDIRREVLLADEIAALTFDLPTLQEVSSGLADSPVAYACMEAFLQGKEVIAADDDYKMRLSQAGEAYLELFEEAKGRTRRFGMVYCALHQFRSVLDAGNSREPETRQPPGRKTDKKQVVTVEELAKNKNLKIQRDAIITPAARELLSDRNKKTEE